MNSMNVRRSERHRPEFFPEICAAKLVYLISLKSCTGG